jgi:hypothetical protein
MASCFNRAHGKLNRIGCFALAGLVVVGSTAKLCRSAVGAEDSNIKIEVQVVSTAGSDATMGAGVLPASHQQVKLIAPSEGNSRFKLVSFCVTQDGRIVAVLNRQDAVSGASGGFLSAIVAAFSKSDANSTPTDDTAADAKKPADSVAEVCILDADGKQTARWPLDFQAQAVNVCPDGMLVLGGAGVLARYDLDGKELARAESPHIVDSRKDPDRLKQQALEMVEQQRSSMKESLKSLEAQKEELSKKDDKSLTAEERQTKNQIDQIVATYKQRVAQQGDQPVTDQEVEAMVQSLTERAQRINAIACNGKFIFCTAPASKGYGYSVWRTDLSFESPKRIVDGLSGCCGQMDIQCCGDEIVVAENSRKRVVRYDSDGKEIASWGKASRDAESEAETFGSCCNPMNTRPVGDKLYVSDSDGRVRRFTLDGKYESEVGKADVSPGCKSSIVDVSPDGNRVYYIDVNNSKICVLDRKPTTE